MNSLPLAHHLLDRDLRIRRALVGAAAVVAIGLTLAIIALSTASGSHAAKPIADRGQTLMHFYGTGAAPSSRPARPQTRSGQRASQHFYGLQP